MHTVLVVDDDERLRELLAEYLSSRGFVVETAADGRTALQTCGASNLDMVVLDVVLPDMDGFDILRRLRAQSQIPVIMLTARGEDTDRIVGLELGADDYLPKPFNPRELVARMQAVLRRQNSHSASESSVLSSGDIFIDIGARKATKQGNPIELTTTEFELLRILVANAGRVIPREQLMLLARGSDWASYDRSVDVHISHLRRKLGDNPRSPELIKTVRGIGYVLSKESEASS